LILSSAPQAGGQVNQTAPRLDVQVLISALLSSKQLPERVSAIREPPNFSRFTVFGSGLAGLGLLLE
jgi:hypothetical protein